MTIDLIELLEAIGMRFKDYNFSITNDWSGDEIKSLIITCQNEGLEDFKCFIDAKDVSTKSSNPIWTINHYLERAIDQYRGAAESYLPGEQRFYEKRM